MPIRIASSRNWITTIPRLPWKLIRWVLIWQKLLLAVQRQQWIPLVHRLPPVRKRVVSSIGILFSVWNFIKADKSGLRRTIRSGSYSPRLMEQSMLNRRMSSSPFACCLFPYHSEFYWCYRQHCRPTQSIRFCLFLLFWFATIVCFGIQTCFTLSYSSIAPNTCIIVWLYILSLRVISS